MQEFLTTGFAAGGGVGVVMAIIKSYQMLIERVPKPGPNGHGQKILLVCEERFDNIKSAVYVIHEEGRAQGKKIDKLLELTATLAERTK